MDTVKNIQLLLRVKTAITVTLISDALHVEGESLCIEL